MGLGLAVECSLKPLFDKTLADTQDSIDTHGEALGDPCIRPGRTSRISFQQDMGMADLVSGRFAFPRQLRQLCAFCIGKPYDVLFVHDTLRLIARSALRRNHNRLTSKNKADKALAGLFNNPTYGDIFSTFSPLRLFTPVGSNITQAVFFVPGTNGAQPATVTGFGAVFTDVDQPDGSRRDTKDGRREARTRIEYFDADGKQLFSSFVPASPGDGSLSFFGLVFDDARIARVLITTGDVAPGPDDDAENDIVMMDDFLYGEPQPLH
jgi:hypothetical protein